MRIYIEYVEFIIRYKKKTPTDLPKLIRCSTTSAFPP